MAGEKFKAIFAIRYWSRLILVPLLGAFLFVWLLNPLRFTIDAFEVELSVQLLDSGRTEIVLPPIGRISAHTHEPPLLLRMTLLNVDLPLLETMLTTKTRQQILPDLKQALRNIAERYVFWLLLLSVLGAVGADFLLGQRNRFEILRSAGIGFAGMGLLLLITVSNFRMEAFSQPQYSGIVQAAPWAVELIDQSFVKANEFSEQMRLLAQNLHTLFERIDQAAPIGRLEADRKILVISDIHNNPVAMDYVEDLVLTFRPDFIINAGDLADYGTPLEAALAQRLADLPVPYVFAPGNHDAPAIIDSIQQMNNGIVLQGEPVKVKEVILTGMPDPSSSRISPALPTPGELDEITGQLENQYRVLGSQLSILVVHSPTVALRFYKQVPIVIAGHTHKVRLETEGNGLYLNPGTTGAAGIRGLQTREEIPYSVGMLYLDYYGQKFYAKAVDIISVRKIGGGLTLDRHVLPTPSDLPQLQPAQPHEPS